MQLKIALKQCGLPGFLSRFASIINWLGVSKVWMKGVLETIILETQLGASTIGVFDCFAKQIN